jgi:hypothetical protein
MQALVPLVVAIPLLVFWGWMFRDMLNNDYLPSQARNLWILAFVLMNVFGAVWYYVTEYRYRH